jgi:hypothetical protein
MGIINEPARPPLMLLGFIALPILGFVAAYVSSVSFRAFADSLSLTLLVGSHLWRFVGLGFSYKLQPAGGRAQGGNAG